MSDGRRPPGRPLPVEELELEQRLVRALARLLAEREAEEARNQRRRSFAR